MEYRLHMGPWNSVFAVPTALVDRYLKLAGKEQLQVLLWMLRHGGEAFSPEALAQELTLDQDAVLDALDYWQQEGLLASREGQLAPAAPPGRSHRPQEPAKRVSPQSITSSTSSVTDPAEWPGV